MDYSKMSFCYCLLIIVFLSNLIQDHTCVIVRRKPCPTQSIKNGIFRVRSNRRVATYKCLPGFKAVGQRSATCLRGEWEGEPPICVKKGCQRVNPPKNGDMVVNYGGAVVMFFCNSGYSLNGSKDVFCDGYRWNGTEPTCQPDNSEPQTFCDFEDENLCGWTKDTRQDFDWWRHNYATPSGHVGTGPSFDHTKGAGQDGYYMYIESSSPRMLNDKARLFSPVYPPDMSRDACFILWYHMYGGTIGSLNVYVKPEDVDLKALVPEFTKKGDQGNKWFRKIIRLQNISLPFQVIVEGVSGSSYVSDIAFDDVQLANGTDCQEPVTDAAKTDTSMLDTGGGGKVFDDAQSCRWRCSGNPGFSVDQSDRATVTPPETPVMVKCDCNLGCEDNQTCCPDYSSYCILAKVTSLPLAPTLGYRTVASVHYFSMFPPPPPSRRPQPPPLPPLPPRPTMASPELPFSSPLPPIFSMQPPVTEKEQLDSSPPILEDVPKISTIPSVKVSPFSPSPIANDKTTEFEIPSPSSTDSPKVYVTSQPPLKVEASMPSASTKTPRVVASTIATRQPPFKTSVTYSDMVEMPTVTTETLVVEDVSKIINTLNKTSTTLPRVTTTIQTQYSSTNVNKKPDLTVNSSSTKFFSRPTSSVVPTVLLTKKNPTKIIVINAGIKPEFRITTPKSIPFKTVPIKTSKIPPRLTSPPSKQVVTKKRYVPPRTTTTATRRPPPSTKMTTGNRMYNPYAKGARSNDVETKYLMDKDLLKRKSGSFSQQQPQQSTRDSMWTSVPTLVGIVAGVVLVVLAVGITMYGIVWRRRASTQNKNCDDDLDVRFLSSDEALDFNLARPSDNDDL